MKAVKPRGYADGFTLMEILIVIAILGILLMLVLPTYFDSMRKSRRADGIGDLLELVGRQERFYAQNSTYTTDIDTAAGLNLGRTVSSEGHYTLSAAACASGTIASCYVLTATPVGGQAGDKACAALSVDSLGQTTASGVDPDNCW